MRVAGDFSSTSLIGDSVIRNSSGNLILQNGTGTSGLRITSSNNVEVRNNLNIISLTASYSVHTDASKNLISVQNSGSGLNLLQTSPTLITPTIGAATGTSLNLSGLTASRLLLTDASKNLVSLSSAGTDGHVLTVVSGSPTWASPTTLITPTIGVASGTSLNLSSLTASRLVLTDASKNLVSLSSAGTAGQILTVVAGSPTWAAPATSGIFIN